MFGYQKTFIDSEMGNDNQQVMQLISQHDKKHKYSVSLLNKLHLFQGCVN